MPKLQARAVPDVFRFVNARCDFLSALTPLQPRYAKKIADEDSLMAVIVAQAMNHGMLGMAETSDITYDVLEETYHQHLRLATLREANHKISGILSPASTYSPCIRSARKPSMVVWTARNSRQLHRRSRLDIRASTSDVARAWSPTRCSPITYRLKPN